jgi:hypothetical protein
MVVGPKHGYLLILAAVAMACRSDRPAADAAKAPAPADATPAAAPASPQVVHVTATDFKLDLPAKIPAGAVTMHLMNEGKEMHQAMIARLEGGKTMADFAQAMKSNGPLPDWVKFIGGPNGIVPGATTTATTVLTPGNYVVVCVIPGADGIAHAAKGMVTAFEVTPATGPEAALPTATDTVQLKDYGFGVSRPLAAGSHTILVENGGPQEHELVLLKLQPDKTVKDFGEWATTGGMKGPPPALPIGGVGAMQSGGSAVFTADLAAGDYAFICFVPDAKDGKPHVMHGMMQQFAVK